MTTRREFFTQLIPKAGLRSRKSDLPETVNLGHLNAFAVNSKTAVTIGGNNYLLETLQEGFRFKNLNEGSCLRLVLNANGTIHCDLKTPWPQDAVLSIMTGEMYKL